MLVWIVHLILLSNGCCLWCALFINVFELPLNYIIILLCAVCIFYLPASEHSILRGEDDNTENKLIYQTTEIKQEKYKMVFVDAFEKSELNQQLQKELKPLEHARKIGLWDKMSVKMQYKTTPFWQVCISPCNSINKAVCSGCGCCFITYAQYTHTMFFLIILICTSTCIYNYYNAHQKPRILVIHY